MASTTPNSSSSSYSISPSPTSTSRTSPPPTFKAISPSFNPEKDHLTTLPPELLLAIISHLPSSSSLLPLSQTNIYLQTFLLNTHAATICNAFITARYSYAASILSATYRDGWFLPTHEAVLGTEKRITREQVRKAGCGCADCRAFLESSRSTTASSSDISLASDSSTQGCLNLPCFPTPPTRASQTSRTCKAQHLFDTPWKLSMPGPMFLVFLERYEWEIETRHAMLEAECKDAGDARREEEERRFSFIVGNYSVRRFLEDVERGFESESTSQRQNYSDDRQRRGLGRRLGGSMKKGWARSKRMLQLKKNSEKAQTQTRNITPPLFGEIEKPETDAMTAQKRDRSWMTGLLWYYGLQTPQTQAVSSPQHQPNSSPPPTHNDSTRAIKSHANLEQNEPQSSQPGTTESGYQEKSESQQIRTKQPRTCMAVVQISIGLMGGKMKQVFRRCKHAGSFQTLDG
ncbi:hypothetical protein BKA65DRAFT_536916 [Rhexocercosporidium sp. MPI-PUGE-AT-0058]|nr:hypothetical protein BKA65DRAFT_536916 [Rhexocercosporidium sp. MPI-PUGE-AT-0058]